MTTTRGRGRPRKNNGEITVDTKLAIEEAAAQIFNDVGFDKATFRLIADTAGDDPKLVAHYFGTKAELFAKTFSMPQQADDIQKVFAAVPRSDWGATIAAILLDNENRIFSATGAGLIRASTTHPDGAAMFREVVVKNSLGPFLASIGVDNAMMRAATLETLLMGLSVSDHILEIPQVPAEEYRSRRTLFATLIQSILTSKLD